MRLTSAISAALLAFICLPASAQETPPPLPQPGPRIGTEIATSGATVPPALLAVGDLDRDGSADFLVATEDSSGTPGIEARSGSSGGLIWAIGSFPLASGGGAIDSSWLRLDDLDGDGIDEFAAVGPSGLEVRSGHTGQQVRSAQLLAGPRTVLALAGDRNGDGLSEVAVLTTTAAGAIFAIFDPAAFAIVRVTNAPNLPHWIHSLKRIDDLDGDLIADFAIGAPTDYLLGGSGGSVRFISGADAREIGGLPNFTLSSYFGAEIEPYFDMNGDGVREVAIAMGATPTLPPRVILVDPTRSLILAEQFASAWCASQPQLTIVPQPIYRPHLILSGVVGPSDPGTGQVSIAEELWPPAHRLTFSIDGSDVARSFGNASDFQLLGDVDGTNTPDFVFSHRTLSGRPRPIAVFQTSAIVPYGSNPNPPASLPQPDPYPFVVGTPDTVLAVQLPSGLMPTRAWFLLGTRSAAQATAFGQLLVDPNAAVLLEIGPSLRLTFHTDPSWQGSTLFAQPIWQASHLPGLLELGPGYRLLF